MEEFINAIDIARPELKFGHYIKNKKHPRVYPKGLFTIIAYFIQFEFTQFTKDNLKQLIELHNELSSNHVHRFKCVRADIDINYCSIPISFKIPHFYKFISMSEFDLNKAFMGDINLGDRLSIEDICKALDDESYNSDILIYIYLYQQLGKYDMIKSAAY